MSYQAYSAVIDATRQGRTGLGPLVLGCVCVIILAYSGSLVFFESLTTLVAQGDRSWLIGGATPGALLARLAGFGFWIAAIALTLPVVHKRPFTDLVGTASLPQFRAVLWGVICLNALVIFLPPWTVTDGITRAQPLLQWISLLPLALIALFIQVSAEEVLFRGYLQSQLAARFRSPLVWIGVPSVLFALGHYNPDAGENAALFVLWAAVFGVLMADLTARSGSIAPAIAVHMVNNIFAMIVIAPPDTLSGLALYHYPFGLSDSEQVRALLPIDFAMMFLAWLVARLVIRR